MEGGGCGRLGNTFWTNCAVLKRDAKIRAGAFTEQLTAERFADVLFSLMLSALLREDYDPATVLEIVCRTLY